MKIVLLIKKSIRMILYSLLEEYIHQLYQIELKAGLKGQSGENQHGL